MCQSLGGATFADQGSSTQIVDSTIEEIVKIATLPAIAFEIARLSDDPNSTPELLNEVISSDPALSARILRVANSTFYGRSGQIGSINRALMLLGLNSVKSIAIAASLDKLFRGGRISPEFNANDLWMHSIAVATGARLLADRSGMVLPDEAFLAGMIHDLGIMVELQTRRSLFIQLVEELDSNPSLTFREAEKQSLGATHEEFGAALCRKWKFPASFEEVTGYHHRPLDLLGDARLLPAMVHVADILAARVGVGYIRTVETDTIDPQLLEMLTLTADDVNDVGEALPEATCEAQLLLSE